MRIPLRPFALAILMLSSGASVWAQDVELRTPIDPSDDVIEIRTRIDPYTAAEIETLLRQIDVDVQSKSCGSAAVIREIVAKCPRGTAGSCLNVLASESRKQNVLEGSSAPPMEFTDTQTALNRAKDAIGGFGTSVDLLTRNVVKELPIPALSGVIDDFVSKQLLSYLQGIGDLDDPQSLGYTINLDQIPFIRARISGFVTPDPKINATLKQRLVAQNQAAALNKIQDSLELGDDYLVEGTLALVTPYTGAEFNHNSLATDLVRQKIRLDEANKYLNALQKTDLKMGVDPKVDDRNHLRAACLLQRLAVYNTLEPSRYAPDFWKLVANQPQVTARYRRLHRDGTVGASADSYRIRIASGLSNITWLKLLTDCKKGFGTDACGAAYDKEFESFRNRHGLGVAAYYEQGHLADISIDVPLFDVGTLPELPIPLPIDLNDSGRFTLEGGRFRRYGAVVGLSLDDPEPGEALPTSMRLDLAGDFYRYNNDPVRLNHDVLRLTLTYRRGGLTLPFHLMYRTKSELEAKLNDKLVVGIGSGLEF